MQPGQSRPRRGDHQRQLRDAGHRRGASVDCTGSVNLQVHSEVDVYVYYGFNDLNLLGGLVTLTGSSKTTTSW